MENIMKKTAVAPRDHFSDHRGAGTARGVSVSVRRTRHNTQSDLKAITGKFSKRPIASVASKRKRRYEAVNALKNNRSVEAKPRTKQKTLSSSTNSLDILVLIDRNGHNTQKKEVLCLVHL